MVLNTEKIHVVGMGGTLRPHSTSLYVLDQALQAAESAGASTEILDLRQLDLPLYVPGRSLEDYPPAVSHLISAVRRADAMLWSTAGYHGTLAGVTKNALDFFQFLKEGDQPYLQNKVIGLISTAGGDMAGVNAIGAMVHSVHSLRGTVAPLHVAIPQARRVVNAQEGFVAGKWQSRLEMLGRQVVELASTLQPDRRISLG